MKRIFILGILVGLWPCGSSFGPHAEEKSPKAKPLPPVRFVNAKEVILEYEVTKVGPSGIGTADIWWTRDDGKTWEKAPNPDRPDDKKNGRFQRVLTLLEGDGIYGFNVVVRSGAGRAKKLPQPGDAPQFRIELDTVPPETALLAPQVGEAGTLILSWKAQDKNLAPKAISLEWSEKSEGPWQAIAADLANTGRYVWKLPPEIPIKVYLRMCARDLAGNEGVAVSAEPQWLDFSEPEAQVVNVVPLK